jgi:hypothetical protein
VAESLEITAPETEVNPINTRVLEDVAPASVARIGKLDAEVDKTLDLQRSGVESTRKQFAESEARMAPLRKGAANRSLIRRSSRASQPSPSRS